MAGIGGAELRMLEHCGIELDYVHVMSRDLLRHADQSSSGRPQSRYFDGGWNSTSRRRRMTKGRLEGFSDGVIAILITIIDRKSTRLNSSHVAISYAVFCLKKKKKK